MNLTTFRKSGVGVTTPVWFAERNHKLYVVTALDSGKIKRLRNNPQVELAPCTSQGKTLGPTQAATARILPQDSEEEAGANVTLQSKYGILYGLFAIAWTLQHGRRGNVFLEIAPVHE
jgi:hypothetical protein